MLNFAVRLILEENGQLLFLKQTKKNGGKYTLIGGTVEDQEFAREALAREAEEEAGIRVDANALELVHVLHRHKLKVNENFLVLYFKAHTFQGKPTNLEPEKFAAIEWHDPKALPEKVSKPTIHVLNAIAKKEIYSEFPERKKVLAFWEQFGQTIENLF